MPVNASETHPGKVKFSSFDRIQNPYGWFFVSLALILLGFFLIYPIVSSLYLSTMSGRGIVQTYVGFGNYLKVVRDPVFLLTLQNTAIFFFVQVPIMLLLALIVASILNNKSLKFRGVFRTGIFLPAVTSLVAYTTLFKMMFSNDGLINQGLLLLRLIKEPIPWLMDPIWARVTVMIAMTWRWTGYNMVFYLSGLQNIPEELYESAEIDGANRFQQFCHITVPILKPMILFTAIMSTIGTLQLFDEPMSFAGTNQATTGPGDSLLTMSVYIYNLCFKYMPNFGYASTVAYMIVILVAVLSVIQFKLAGDKK